MKVNMAPELRKALEEQRLTANQWAVLALKEIPFRSKSWRSQAEMNVASVIKQAMGAARRCRYCHSSYSGKFCDNRNRIEAHPHKIMMEILGEMWNRK